MSIDTLSRRASIITILIGASLPWLVQLTIFGIYEAVFHIYDPGALTAPIGLALGMWIAQKAAWPIGLLIVSIGVIRLIFPAPQRLDSEQCMVCDYCLRGNESGICPECGSDVHGKRKRWWPNG